MKPAFFLIGFFLCFQSPTWAKAKPLSLRIPDGMKSVSPFTKADVPAKLFCDLYEVKKTADGWGPGHLLKHEDSPAFLIGERSLNRFEFPAPYDNIDVAINATLMSFDESEDKPALPYIQAYFLNDDDNEKSINSATFQIQNVQKGDGVFLRDQIRIKPDVRILFQCGLELL